LLQGSARSIAWWSDLFDVHSIMPKKVTPLNVLVIDDELLIRVQKIVTAAQAASTNITGDCYGSTRRQRVPVSVSMDLNPLGNAAGTVDIRDLSAVP